MVNPSELDLDLGIICFLLRSFEIINFKYQESEDTLMDFLAVNLT